MDNDSILEIVWRQRGVVGMCVGVVLLLAGGYLLLATRYYSGYAKLYVQQVAPQMLNEQPQQFHENENFLATQKEVLSSTPVVAMALGSPGVRDLKTFEAQDNTFTYFKKNLSVDVDKRSELLNVQFDTPVREDAQKIVAALVDAYVNYQSKARSANGTEILAILTAQADQQKAALRAKQAELQKFRTANGVFNGTDGKTDVALAQLQSLTNELTKQQLERITAESAWKDVQASILNTPARQERFAKVRDNAPGYSAPSAIDDQALRTQMINAQSGLQELLASGRFGPRHPLVLRYQDTIDGLNVNYAYAVWRRFVTAKQREDDLQASFNKQQQLALDRNEKAVQDANLQRSIDSLAASVTDLEKKMRDVSVTQGGGAPNIQVIEPPSASKAPTKPHYLQTLALALLGGLIGGCGIACVRDWYDYRLRSADEIKQSLGITVLGLIPRVSDETSPIARGQKIHIDPTSPVAEAYRSLRTAIYFGSKEQPPKTILVTSPERGDGKSTSASNLAIAMAQAGRRVLLVDADLRAPMQDLIFSLNGRIGLANVLAGKESVEAAIRHTGIEHLDLLPAGTAGRSPAELLNSPKFIELLEGLAEKYEHVVIDSPPLLAVTDARVISASADATVLVLRAGKSNRKLSELSIDGLVSVGAKLLGAVVNDVQRRGGDRYYGAYGRDAYAETSFSGRSEHSGAGDRQVVQGEHVSDGHHNGFGNAGLSDEESLAMRSRLTS